MRIIEKVIYKQMYKSQAGLGGEKPFESFCKLILHFDFKGGLRFTASTSDTSFCNRNPIKALINLLEHENIKGIKYDILKDAVRNKGLHKQL